MKLILLTGFLGSGKTTLLTNLLKTYEGTKIGVLMNEFGETSIDGKLIKGGNFDLIELTNGSIFCACLKENFIKGLAEFLSYDLEIVFVESSGVADPSNMGTILETVTKLAAKAYDYAGSICIVDGLYFLRQFDVILALEKQIFYASAVIINKTDLQTPEILGIIEKKIRAINHNVEIYRAIFCEAPIQFMVKNMTVGKAMNEPTGNTWESRLVTKILKTHEIVDFQKFSGFLHEIKFSAHRIKGFVRTNSGNYEVSCVNDFAVMNPWFGPVEKTEVVFISSVGIRIISDLIKLWGKYLGHTPFVI
ncbi:CobW family GTP-binding protein [Acetobacterium bakii]|uniref:Cobalamin biosynthesis protein P47K n=1 Tax=Acetobacterium bakii TaxID=52689 RepID=A0A0L6U306_9FIRM|nr:GTP-binding protein [Acetobacterium bakii]KNZ42876.1 cobalamin biosynthesis protein P47K [Acetobacterium bakii]